MGGRTEELQLRRLRQLDQMKPLDIGGLSCGQPARMQIPVRSAAGAAVQIAASLARPAPTGTARRSQAASRLQSSAPAQVISSIQACRRGPQSVTASVRILTDRAGEYGAAAELMLLGVCSGWGFMDVCATTAFSRSSMDRTYAIRYLTKTLGFGVLSLDCVPRKSAFDSSFQFSTTFP